MTENEQLVHTFYKAFQDRNFKTMQECYSDRATFSDPVFRNLNAGQVRAMWEMFLVKNDSLTISFGNIETVGEMVTARWKANYILSSTGRPVTNNIRSIFRIKNNQIVRHTDRFDLYGWTRQALGIKGILLGWTPFVKTRIRRKAMASLLAYIREKNRGPELGCKKTI